MTKSSLLDTDRHLLVYISDSNLSLFISDNSLSISINLNFFFVCPI